MTKPRAVLLPCRHFSQDVDEAGAPVCLICRDKAQAEATREAASRVVAETSRPDPTDAPATRPASGAGATGGTKFAGAGVYDGMLDGVYHSDPLRAYGTESLSATSAKLLLLPSTPAHYRWAIDHPDERRTPAMIFGKAFHAAALGTAELEAFDGYSWDSKAGREFLADFPDHGDRVPVLERDVPKVYAMARSVQKHPVAQLCLAGGKPEQAMFTEHRSGVWMRGKVDYLPEPVNGTLYIPDLKSTQSAAPGEFDRSAADYSYHRQDDWYSRQAVALGLARDARMVFVAVESHPPYLVAVHENDPADRRRAHALNEASIATFARCLETGEWPGYPPGVHRMQFPIWAVRTEETALDNLEGETE